MRSTYLDIDLIAFSTFTGRNLVIVLRLYEVLDDPKGARIQPVVLYTSNVLSKKHSFNVQTSVNKVYLITELAHRGDLMNVSKTNVLTDENLRTITLQVMNGLLYLHNNFITHNDLKPSNILLTNDGTVKIADFGVSGLGRIRTDSCGTPAFMAPEGSTFFFFSLSRTRAQSQFFHIRASRTPRKSC